MGAALIGQQVRNTASDWSTMVAAGNNHANYDGIQQAKMKNLCVVSKTRKLLYSVKAFQLLINNHVPYKYCIRT